MRDPTGRSRCFGFVVFADPVVVDIVLQKTHTLDNKQVSGAPDVEFTDCRLTRNGQSPETSSRPIHPRLSRALAEGTAANREARTKNTRCLWGESTSMRMSRT